MVSDDALRISSSPRSVKDVKRMSARKTYSREPDLLLLKAFMILMEGRIKLLRIS